MNHDTQMIIHAAAAFGATAIAAAGAQLYGLAVRRELARDVAVKMGTLSTDRRAARWTRARIAALFVAGRLMLWLGSGFAAGNALALLLGAITWR